MNALPLPPWPEALALALCGAALAAVSGLFAGGLRMRLRVDVAYTRKTFHFIIFSAATVLHAGGGGFAAVNAFACGVVAVLAVAVLRGRRSITWRSLARPRDAPHQTFFIVVPLLTTAAGGLTSNLLFADAALVGYLVTGWGDAVGEYAGRRFGRHSYRVPTLLGVRAHRTLEGSLAVALASGLAAFLALTLGLHAGARAAIPAALVIATATAVTEAVSPHGLDNFTTMVVAAGLAVWIGL